MFVILSSLRLKYPVLTPVIFGFLLLSLLFVGVAQADSAEWQTLKQGKVVVKESVAAQSTVPSVVAKILIAKPPAKVWSVVSDPETLMEEEKKVRKVKVLSSTPTKQNVEFSVLMTRLFPPFNYVLLQELSPPHLVTFHRVSGSFRDIDGSWRLTPVENGTKTILSYTLKLDPGPLVPKTLLLAAVKSDLPNMMRNAKLSITKNAK